MSFSHPYRPAASRAGLPARAAAVACLVFALVFAPNAWGDGEPVWHTDLDAAVDKAEATGAYILVDLYAEWCGWCKKLEEEVFPTQAFRDFAADKVLLRVDVEDGADGTALQARHGAFNLPTTLILDADGVRVGMVQGFASAESLVARFEAEIATWQRLVSRFPAVLSQGSYSLQRSLAEEMLERRDGVRAAQLYDRLLDAAGPQNPETPWLYTQKADALRHAEDYEAAAATLIRAREAAHALSGATGALAEKLDLLAYQIAQDAGDCQKAKATLQDFLSSHPESKNRRVLAKRLRALEEGGGTICA